MSSDQMSDVPGGYFVGRPSNHAADKTEEPPHAAGEQNPATAQTPGDYFVGRPESHHKQQTTTKHSTPSFLAKCSQLYIDVLA
ncbi:uncharacterized protein LOC8071576 isoform X2 [Sorghum bicolor]|uniref:uncharacterized protein LOC8071576 isoform X2 n=1 Tax=Sorghum bicolor TaxID=4558 RepID=UPI000B423711|nr:uncharacterized protein LOC8071576 isoform X2 [Sorghum bicolor]|eukprot:XP_021316409.1 uncharacterized protein LOC8071576 isoform X2 [Sorghum bicolor]